MSYKMSTKENWDKCIGMATFSSLETFVTTEFQFYLQTSFILASSSCKGIDASCSNIPRSSSSSRSLSTPANSFNSARP